VTPLFYDEFVHSWASRDRRRWSQPGRAGGDRWTCGQSGSVSRSVGSSDTAAGHHNNRRRDDAVMIAARHGTAPHNIRHRASSSSHSFRRLQPARPTGPFTIIADDDADMKSNCPPRVSTSCAHTHTHTHTVLHAS